ncbi:hypothetical protein KSF78_0002031 [Schistosoma japonicum]|nr:hypothetical protein KSF78_0002029 [Schistosoma japonicum]KAH8855491.1 hypothetical protein KSF78_0002031 [Schistosoma japonicum]
MYHRNSTDRSYDDQQLNSVDLSKPINSLKQMPIIPPLCDLDYTWILITNKPIITIEVNGIIQTMVTM